MQKKVYTNADEVVSHNDRRKLQPNNDRFVDSFFFLKIKPIRDNGLAFA